MSVCGAEAWPKKGEFVACVANFWEWWNWRLAPTKNVTPVPFPKFFNTSINKGRVQKHQNQKSSVRGIHPVCIFTPHLTTTGLCSNLHLTTTNPLFGTFAALILGRMDICPSYYEKVKVRLGQIYALIYWTPNVKFASVWCKTFGKAQHIVAMEQILMDVKILKNKTNNVIKSNKCNQCEYASSQTSGLRRHLKTHSWDKLNTLQSVLFP